MYFKRLLVSLCQGGRKEGKLEFSARSATFEDFSQQQDGAFRKLVRGVNAKRRDSWYEDHQYQDHQRA